MSYPHFQSSYTLNMMTTLHYSCWLAISLSLAFAPAYAVDLPHIETLEARLTTESIDPSQPTQDASALFNELQALEYWFAGQAEYDHLYARTALLSGHPAEALWPLERLVASAPTNAEYRLLLAQAHLTLGRPQLAILQLERAQQLVELRSDQAESLDALLFQAVEQSNQEAQPAFQLLTRIELGLGYDSNVSTAPGYRFELNQRLGEETPSLISELRLMQRLSWKAQDSIRIEAGYQLRDFRPYQEQDFTRQHLRLFLGTHKVQHRWQWSLTPQLTWSWKDGQYEYRDSTLGGQAQYQASHNMSWLLFGQWSQLSYQEPWEQNTAYLRLAGGGWSHVYRLTPTQPLRVTLMGYAMQADQDTHPRGDYLGLGANLNAAWSYSTRWVYTAAYSGLYRDFSCSAQQQQLAAQQDFSCNPQRRDFYSQTTFSGRYQLKPQLALIPQLSWTHQTSNEAPFDYRRLSAKVSLRYDFPH